MVSGLVVDCTLVAPASVWVVGLRPVGVDDDEPGCVHEPTDRHPSLSACVEGIAGDRLENQEWYDLAAPGTSGMSGHGTDIGRPRRGPNDAGNPVVPSTLDTDTETLTGLTVDEGVDGLTSHQRMPIGNGIGNDE